MTQREPSEEEVRAALEEQLKRLTVDDMLIESAVSLLNLAARRAGIAPGTEGEKDLAQVRTAVEAVRALMPVLEGGRHAEQLPPLRDALARLQMAYAQEAGAAAPAGPQGPGAGEPAPGAPGAGEGAARGPAPEEPPGSSAPGPAQRSGRLWVPGQ